MSVENLQQALLEVYQASRASELTETTFAGLEAIAIYNNTSGASGVVDSVNYKGTWNCSGGTFPTLASKGYAYVCSVAGTISGTQYRIGDWLVYNGTIWNKITGNDIVVSVNGQSGVVSLDLDDIENGATYGRLTNTQITDLTDAEDSALHYHSTDRARANHTGTQTASTISDFDTEVSNNTDVAANTAARHSAITIADTASLDLSLTGQALSGVVLPAGVDHDQLLNTHSKLMFKTIAVSGQSDIVADSDTDTLSFSPSSGIALSTNATTDTLTVTNIDLGTVSRTAHESAYDHALLHSPITVSDSLSIDLTLTGQNISGVVLPAGVDHNQLLNTHNLTTNIDHTLITNIGTEPHSSIDSFMSRMSGICTDRREPTGFTNRTTSSLSFNNTSREFTITGTNFEIYASGYKKAKNTETIEVPNVNGLHYIYYTNSGTVLETSTTEWAIIGPNVPIATVYWNGTTGLIGDERHGYIMDGMTHAYLHWTVGVRYKSGLTGTFGNTTFSLTAGVVYDEDIQYSIGAQTECRVFYKNGSSDYSFSTKGTIYYYTSGGNIYYNNGTALTAVPSNQYVAYWVFATNDPDCPIYSLMGQRIDGNITNARNNNKYESLSLGSLPFVEMKLLYRVILRNDASPYEETQDLRTISNLPSGTYIASSHSALTDLVWGTSGHTIGSSDNFVTPTQRPDSPQSGTVRTDASNGLFEMYDGSTWTQVDHNTIKNLATGDVHTQYALLAGRSGGQTITGGTESGDDLTLQSTSNVTKGNIIIPDGEKLSFGTGLDGNVYASSDDLYIENDTSDKDIIFKINDGGVDTEVMRVDGSASQLLMGASKTVQFSDHAVDKIFFYSNTYKMGIAAGTLYYVAATSAVHRFQIASTSTFYIDNTGCYVPDTYKLQVGTGKDGQIYSSSDDVYFDQVTQDKDIILRVNDGGVTTTVMTLDGSESTVALKTGVGINEFSNDGTLGGNSDLAVPTEKAVKTYVDALSASSGVVNEGVTATNINGLISGDGSFVTVAKNDVGGTIASFSTDGTLGGNTDVDIPTEKAVKTYVDSNEKLSIKYLDSINYTITDTDGYQAILVNPWTTSGVVDLPTNNDNLGRQIDVYKISNSSHNAIIRPEGVDTINGATSNIVINQQWGKFSFLSTQSGWVGDSNFSNAPTGTVAMYAGSTAPTGWLLCDGSALNRSSYADLYAKIGTTYGVGDGATTYNLPDFEGIFPRGAGTGNSKITRTDSSAYTGTLGTYQNDAAQKITGTASIDLLTRSYADVVQKVETGVFSWSSTASVTRYPSLAGTSLNIGLLSFSSDGSTSPHNARTDDHETYPANLSINFIIKY